MTRNPYVFDSPLTQPSEVYFRAKQTVEGCANALLKGRYVSLLGPRVGGTTSLMYDVLHTASDLSESCRWLYVDLAVLEGDDEESVLRNALQVGEWSHPKLKPRSSSVGRASGVRGALLSTVKEKPIRLLVALDNLDSNRLHKDLVRDIVRWARALYNNRQEDAEFGKISVLIGGSQYPYSLSTGPGSPFNIAEKFWLRDLIHEETGQLVKKGEQISGLVFDDDAVGMIAELTDGDKYFIQRLCHMCVAQALITGAGSISRDMVAEVVDRLTGLDCGDDKCFDLAIGGLKTRAALTEVALALIEGQCARATDYFANVDDIRLCGFLEVDGKGECSFRNRIYGRFLARQKGMLRHLLDIQLEADGLVRLHAAALNIASVFDPENALEQATWAALRATNADMAAIYLHNKVEDSFCLGGQIASVETLQVPHKLTKDGLARKVIETRRPISVTDPAVCGECEFERQPCYCVWLPLVAGRGTPGVLVVASNNPDHFDQATMNAAEIAARHLSSAVDRTKLVDALGTIGGVEIASASRDQILQQIVDLVRNLLNVPVALVWGTDQDATKLRILACSGKVDQGYIDDFRLETEQEPVKSFLESLEPVFIKDVQRVPAFQGLDAVSEMGWKSLLAMPLRTGDRLVGIIEAYSLEHGQVAPSHKVVLKLLANQAVMTIDNAELYTREKTQAENLGALNQIANACLAGKGVHDLLSLAVDILQGKQDKLGRATCAVGRLDAEGRYLDFVSYRDSSSWQVSVNELPNGVWSSLLSGERCSIDDLSAYPVLAQQFTRRHPKSIVLVPLKGTEKFIGVLSIGHTAPLELGDDDWKFVETLVDELALGVQSIQLFQQVQRAGKDLDLSLKTLVHQLSTGPGYVSAVVDALLADKYGSLTDKQRERLAKANQALLAYKDLLSNVNIYGRIKGGRLQLRTEITDLSSVVLGEVVARREDARKRGVSLRTKGLKQLPIVDTDRGFVEIILRNILDNAIKFTPAGGLVRVSARVAPHSVYIRVDDTGPGMPVGEGKEVFDEFHSLSPNAVRGQQGMGLGLYICWRLAEMLGGQIASSRKKTRGARITISIPRQGSECAC
jgi:signal transduction histidine kinase